MSEEQVGGNAGNEGLDLERRVKRRCMGETKTEAGVGVGAHSKEDQYYCLLVKGNSAVMKNVSV